MDITLELLNNSGYINFTKRYDKIYIYISAEEATFNFVVKDMAEFKQFKNVVKMFLVEAVMHCKEIDLNNVKFFVYVNNDYFTLVFNGIEVSLTKNRMQLLLNFLVSC